jgi:outer membrane protein OmpA-like peptidoglycan-associated protein
VVWLSKSAAPQAPCLVGCFLRRSYTGTHQHKRKGKNMKAIRIITKVLLLIACVAVLCAYLPAQARAEGQDVTVNGLIVSRDGENMVVRSDSGSVPVTLTKETRAYVVKGWLCIRREEMGTASLVPGLLVEVDAQRIGNQTVAQVIRCKPEDLRTANAIQAGLEMTRQQLQAEQEKNEAQAKEILANQQKIEASQQKIEANQQAIEANQQAIAQVKADDAAMSKRFGDLDEYDVKGETTLLFDVNSAKLSEKGQKDLKALAATAKGTKGYLIQVAGYTDSSGRADLNQDLSDSRAESVVVYLRVSCEVPIYRVVFPAAMGMARPVASNETAKGKAENRRAVAQIIVNRGLSQ